MEQEKQWTAVKRSVLTLIFMNSEKIQPAREAESRYNSRHITLMEARRIFEQQRRETAISHRRMELLVHLKQETELEHPP